MATPITLSSIVEALEAGDCYGAEPAPFLRLATVTLWQRREVRAEFVDQAGLWWYLHSMLPRDVQERVQLQDAHAFEAEAAR